MAAGAAAFAATAGAATTAFAAAIASTAFVATAFVATAFVATAFAAGAAAFACVLIALMRRASGVNAPRSVAFADVRRDGGEPSDRHLDPPASTGERTATIEAYLINLDRRTERLAVTMPALRRFGFTAVARWPAVDSRTFSRDEMRALVKPEALAPIWNHQRAHHHELSVGAVGCYLSHVRLWESFVRTSNRECLIVMEDDTNPTMTTDELDAIIRRELPSDFDVLFFGVFGEHDPQATRTIEKLTSPFYGTHAYLIHRKCIPMLLERALPMDMQLDSWLSRFGMDATLNIYTIRNSGWLQNEQVNSTDIQTPMVA